MAFTKTKVVVEGHEEELVVEIPENEAPSWATKTAFSFVGKPTPRIDGVERITGKAIYTADLQLPGMLHGKILRSPHPHAKVKKIDDSLALKIPGVVTVLHSQNTDPMAFEGNNFVFNPAVRFVGDEVAVVIAETERAARDGRELIKVEYEVLPFVIDTMAALEPNAPKVQVAGNIVGGKPTVIRRGDLDAGFGTADLIVEETYTTPVVHHTTMETHGSVATWEGNHLTVYDSTQSVYRVQQGLASTFKLPSSQVRVIMNYMGGGFGSKTGVGKYTVMAALASKLTSRPVKIFLDRDEEFLATIHRPSTIQKLRAGVKKDGILTVLILEAYVPTGAYLGRFIDIGRPVRELYNCANVETKITGVYLNLMTHGPMRGPGSTEGMYGLECLMDLIAAKLNMDPLELRRKNHTNIGDQVKNIPYSSKGLMESYEYGSDKIDWKNRRNTQPGGGNGKIRRGVGMGSLIWGAGGGPPSSANVFVYPDGTATVRSAVNDLGTGVKTVAALIAAEELGIPLEKISVSAADTDSSTFDLGSFGSRVTPSFGPAVRNAAYDARLQIAEAAAVLLNIPADRVQFENGVFFKEGEKEKGVPLTKVIKAFNRPVIGNGFRGPNPPEYVLDSFGAQFVEVEVNTETGELEIANFVAAHDAGRVMNPLTILSQIYGGIALGSGYGLHEEQVVDRATGIPVTTDWLSYKISTYADLPPIDTYLVPQTDPVNNINVKGMAEPPCMPTAPAIANAVYNAIGVQIKDLPVTPAKILAALMKS